MGLNYDNPTLKLKRSRKRKIQHSKDVSRAQIHVNNYHVTQKMEKKLSGQKVDGYFFLVFLISMVSCSHAVFPMLKY